MPEIKRKKIVCVDLDDTLTDLLPVWVEALNKRYVLSVNWRKICDWNIQHFFPTLTADQVFGVLHEDGFWKNVKPKLFAADVLRWMVECGFDVYICTASYYKNIEEKFTAIIEKYFPFIDWDHVIVTSNKQLIRCNYFIDDAPHNLIGSSGIKFLMDAPHNQYFDAAKHKITRVYDWDQIQDIFVSIIKFNMHCECPE